MRNVIGSQLTLTIFGESHGHAVGGVLDGIPPGIYIDYELIASMMEKRKAAGAISTARHEEDIPDFLSGIKDGFSEGTPIAFIIPNRNAHSGDYNALRNLPRPGHADYAGHIHYCGFEDSSGGGHFSGRLTAVMVTAGAICMHMLHQRGIEIGTHIAKLYKIDDRPFDESDLAKDIHYINRQTFGTLDEKKGEAMIAEIMAARSENDSLGGILDTAVIGLEAGIGEPEFDSIESELAQAIFSIPAVKGITFGAGYAFADMKGSQANDAFYYEKDKVKTRTNHNGGINGGISNGMPIRFQTVVKPTPSIAQRQETVNLETRENTTIEISGRHDPAVIHRARVVVDAMTAFVLVNLLMERYGINAFSKEKI